MALACPTFGGFLMQRRCSLTADNTSAQFKSNRSMMKSLVKSKLLAMVGQSLYCATVPPDQGSQYGSDD